MQNLSDGAIILLITKTVDELMQKMPYNGQEEFDYELAQYFISKAIIKHIKPSIDKFERKIKGELKRLDNQQTIKTISSNYNLIIEYGTPRQTFSKDMFIQKIVEELKVPKYKLVGLATSSVKESAIPISLSVDYIGDIRTNK